MTRALEDGGSGAVSGGRRGSILDGCVEEIYLAKIHRRFLSPARLAPGESKPIGETEEGDGN